MRDNDSSLHAYDLLCREIRHVAVHLLRHKRVNNILLINQHVAGKIQDDNAVLHQADGVFVDHALCIFHGRYMDSDIVAVLVDLIRCLGVIDLLRQSPCGIHGYIRVIAIHLHTEADSRVRHEYADGSQSDNAQLFALKLGSGESFFLFLRDLGDIAVFFVLLNPVDAADNVAGRQKHSRDHQLLHTVRIGSGSVEYNDPLFGAALQRYIVHACPGAGDHFESLRELHLVHLRASDEDGVRFFCFLCAYIIFIQLIQSHL